MHGGAGATWRRWVILAEFVIGAVGGLDLGTLVLVDPADPIWVLIGVWLVGVGLNYLPLALHAISLSRPGALERELAGVDIGSELRFYTTAQFRVLVPLWLAILGVSQW